MAGKSLTSPTTPPKTNRAHLERIMDYGRANKNKTKYEPLYRFINTIIKQSKE